MALFKTSMVLLVGFIFYILSLFFFLFITWLLWRYSVGDMIPWTLPMSVEKPDFLVYCSFWLMVSIGLQSARAIWHDK